MILLKGKPYFGFWVSVPWGAGEGVGICLETTVIACLSMGGWGEDCL